jgi:hypothetical protein
MKGSTSKSLFDCPSDSILCAIPGESFHGLKEICIWLGKSKQWQGKMNDRETDRSKEGSIMSGTKKNVCLLLISMFLLIGTFAHLYVCMYAGPSNRNWYMQ